MTPAANAAHYHVDCNGHGFVHGELLRDGSFFSRVEGGPCSAGSRCDYRTQTGYVAYGGAGAGTTCNNWSRAEGFQWEECGSYAYTELNGRFGGHQHYPEC